MKRLIKICSLFLFFTSCYINKNISEKNRIYIDKIENYTNQSMLSFTIREKIEKIILNYSGYTLTNMKEIADYTLSVKILKFERVPVFFDKKDIDNIVGAKYRIEVQMKVNDGRKENAVLTKNLIEDISSSIYKEYREEKIFEKLSEQIAQRIYFELLKLKNR
ncbi:MAG TPA: LPS assembly lipoprotein LptE [bacterium]|nr:LPS assembly lipoprotein LptE [bacterium]HOM26285.1 LPS assembly lipoprotein LptE [bacterium]